MVLCNGPEDAREALIQRLLRRYEELLRRRLTSGPQTLDEIEREISEISSELNKISQEEKIADAVGLEVPHTCMCSNGHSSVLKSWNTRQLTTLHGKYSIRRAYYYCTHCRAGFCPADATLGIGPGEVSVGFQALVTRLSCYLPSRKAAIEAQLLTGTAISHSTVQRICQSAGDQISRDWQAKEELLWCDRLPDPERPVKMIQTTMDGVMIFVGKQWREVKVGVAYERDTDGGVSTASYYATLKPSADFGRRWHTLNHVAGADKTKKVAVVADGADWIWAEVGKYRPGIVQVLDNMHGLSHIWSIAHARYGQGSAKAVEWMEVQKERLGEDKVEEVITEIEKWRPRKPQKVETRRVELGYIKTHKHRMKYKTFEDAGFHIGSGVVEAANKNVVQARMKRAGMRWECSGAEAQLQLLTAWHTCQTTDFADVCRRANAYRA